MENIKISGNGYIDCKSEFYSADDVLSEGTSYEFVSGLNFLKGEIDSGIWAISYLLSMLKYDGSKKLIFSPLTAVVDGAETPLKKIWPYSCYLDEAYPLFSDRKPINMLVEKGIKKSDMKDTAEGIRDLFRITPECFSRPITEAKKESFKAMASIGYANGKNIFCFPWLSKKVFQTFHKELLDLFQVLESSKKIVIVPLGLSEDPKAQVFENPWEQYLEKLKKSFPDGKPDPKLQALIDLTLSLGGDSLEN